MSRIVPVKVGEGIRVVNDTASKDKPSFALVNWTRGRSHSLGKIWVYTGRARTLQGKLKDVLKSRYFGNNHIRVTFNTLPQDIVIGILFSFSSFNSLHAFLTSSSIAYRLFNHYSTTILTQTARDILGDAWEEATTILVWQRNSNSKGIVSDYAAVEKDLEFEFVLRRGDIPQLVANQKFIESCSDAFAAFRSDCRNRPHATSRGPIPLVPSSYTPSVKMFYSMWLLSLRFRYETIETFAAHEPITVDDCIGYYVVSRIMLNNNHFRNFIYVPRCPDSWGKVLSRNLFSVWLRPLRLENNPNPLLRQKMISHIIAAVAGGMAVPAGNSDHWRRVFLRIFQRFEQDYATMEFKALIHKYNIS